MQADAAKERERETRHALGIVCLLVGTQFATKIAQNRRQGGVVWRPIGR